MKQTNIAITSLHPFAGNPYRVRDDAEMDALVESIREYGVYTPLIVRPMEGQENEYEVISGHRRLYAAQKAGLSEVPALIYPLDRSAAAIAVVDNGGIALSVGVELSYLDEQSQRQVLEQCEINDCTPSYSQAVRMHKFEREGMLDAASIQAIMAEQKPNQRERVSLPVEQLRRYFPKHYTPQKMQDAILKLMEEQYRQRERSRERDTR